ncbi:MAG: histidine phosphatase family protein [Gaiellaceae bacterium]
MPTRIILVRHGETDWNFEHRWQGHADTPLNDKGRAQARELADRFDGEQVAAVYSSDLLRARETARILAERLGLEVTTVPALRERSFGLWEGLRHEDIVHRFPGLDDSPDAETREAMARRVLVSLRAIAASHPGETVLVVSHGGPIRAALRHHEHPAGEEAVANCSVIDLEVD